MPGDTGQIDQTTITPASATATASGISADAESRPLLTVIYPVFDVRGEVVERVRLWTEKQDLEPHRYRVFVVADIETSLDEARLREVLRNHDVILRVPGVGREADFWNAGARAAETRWILFVEGHGLPEPNCLSALAAWIEAHPQGEACNFRIENLEHHRAARLMKRWFGEIQSLWSAPSTWRRLHRAAFAIRRDLFEAAGPLEPKYGQFAPPLLSARLHQRGLSIALIPTSRVIHDDSRELSAHHDDTADYVRGEMDARANSDPVFFEKYFGPPPSQGTDMIQSAPHARGMLRGLVAAALHRPGEASDLMKQAWALLPVALVGLRNRARLLAALTRADEFAVMHLPLPEEVRWKRFLLAHHRLIRTEQMLWIARNPSPSLRAGPENQRWPIDTIGQHAIIGLHALEQFGADAFRWTHPVFLLRIAPTARGALTFETRNLRSPIDLSDVVVVADGMVLPSRDIELDDTGNIRLNIRPSTAPEGETEIVVIVKDLCEPASASGPGRRLGLPLFSVGFDGDDAGGLSPRP